MTWKTSWGIFAACILGACAAGKNASTTPTVAAVANAGSDEKSADQTRAVSGNPRTDLIPRGILFGNPERTDVLISPDGKYLSWLAPSGGVLNVWVAPIDKLAEAKASIRLGRATTLSIAATATPALSIASTPEARRRRSFSKTARWTWAACSSIPKTTRWKRFRSTSTGQAHPR